MSQPDDHPLGVDRAAAFENYVDAVRGAEIALRAIQRAADAPDPGVPMLEALDALDAAGPLARPAFAREIGRGLAIRLAKPPPKSETAPGKGAASDGDDKCAQPNRTARGAAC